MGPECQLHSICWHFCIAICMMSNLNIYLYLCKNDSGFVENWPGVFQTRLCMTCSRHTQVHIARAAWVYPSMHMCEVNQPGLCLILGLNLFQENVGHSKSQQGSNVALTFEQLFHLLHALLDNVLIINPDQMKIMLINISSTKRCSVVNLLFTPATCFLFVIDL
jgi:hypothetical protein